MAVNQEKPRLGGWAVAVVLLGLLGGAIGYFDLRHKDQPRADHVLKWGLIWTVISVGVWLVLVTVLVLAIAWAVGSGSRSSGIALVTSPVVTAAQPTTTDATASQNAFAYTGGSENELKAKLAANPQDSQAWRDLATFYEQKQQTKQAIGALSRYVALRPNDQGALAELGNQWGTIATGYSNDYTAAGQSPAKKQAAYSHYLTAERNAETAYKKLVRLDPSDATTQLQLGQAAQSAADKAVARAAFLTFLRLTPNDPIAPQVRQTLRSLH